MKNVIIYILPFIYVNLFAQIPTLTLTDCINNGLENNYSLRIIKNDEQISKNNQTIGNAGYLPTLDLEGGYSGSLANIKNNLSGNTQIKYSDVYNANADANIYLNWTVFDGFKIQANYSKLKELRDKSELQTREAIEDLLAEIISEYYT